jgi:hypothetical protein
MLGPRLTLDLMEGTLESMTVEPESVIAHP